MRVGVTQRVPVQASLGGSWGSWPHPLATWQNKTLHVPCAPRHRGGLRPLGLSALLVQLRASCQSKATGDDSGDVSRIHQQSLAKKQRRLFPYLGPVWELCGYSWRLCHYLATSASLTFLSTSIIKPILTSSYFIHQNPEETCNFSPAPTPYLLIQILVTEECQVTQGVRIEMPVSASE